MCDVGGGSVCYKSQKLKNCVQSPLRSEIYTLVYKVLSEVTFEDRKSAIQQREKTHKKILPFVTQYHPAVPNLKIILMSKWHLIQNQPSLRVIYKRASHYLVHKREIAQRHTRSIQTLKAKNTHLRTTGVKQACHNFLISVIYIRQCPFLHRTSNLPIKQSVEDLHKCYSRM